MNSRIYFYGALCLIWLALSAAIYLGWHERILGQAEDWKKYLAMGLCVTMMCFNILRIYIIRQAALRSKQPHDKAF